MRVSQNSLQHNGSATFLQGNYLYIADFAIDGRNAFEIWDISNPAAPVRTSLSSFSTTGANGIAVAERYAYVVNGLPANGFEIWDVSNPASPSRMATRDLNNGTASPWGIHVQGRHAYITSVTNNGIEKGSHGFFEIWDISVPDAPVRVSAVLDLNGWGHGIHVQGNYAYLADFGTANAFEIWDVSDPASPVRVSQSPLANNGYWITVQGRYAYIMDNASANSFEIWDVSNPTSPWRASLTNFGSGVQVEVQGHHAYLGSGKILDVSNPAIPVLVATSDLANGGFLVRVQGRYAFYAESGTRNGFEVWHIGDLLDSNVGTDTGSKARD